MMEYEKDLVVLVPDKNAQFFVEGVLSQAAAMGLRMPARQLDTHPLRDTGCMDADLLLESQAGRFAHALVVADYERSGRNNPRRVDVEAALEAKLAKAGWGPRARVIVPDPGVGRWLLEHQLGERWSRDTAADDAVERELRRRRIPKSPSLYRALGERLATEGEPDPAWQRLLFTLHEWFGAEHAEATPAARFDALVGWWMEETALSSSLRDIVAHPAYQQIIALGPAALPLILRDLERQPRHWSPALRAITGASPVPKEHAGKLPLIAEDWLRWARENDHAW